MNNKWQKKYYENLNISSAEIASAQNCAQQPTTLTSQRINFDQPPKIKHVYNHFRQLLGSAYLSPQFFFSVCSKYDITPASHAQHPTIPHIKDYERCDKTAR